MRFKEHFQNFLGKENRDEETFRRDCVWFFKALWASALFLCISLLMGMYLEMNDDPSIAYLLSLRNNDYSPFQWKLFSSILHFLFVNFPVVNWWTVNAVWLSAFSISYVVYRRYPAHYADASAGIVLVALWVTAGHCLNFTRTAAAVAIGGCLLLLFLWRKATNGCWIG